MIGEAASYYYLWVALRALLPVALGAFLAGLVLAWVIWSLGRREGGEVIQSFVAAGLSPEVIFLLDGIDWLKYLVALFFFFLGLFAGWWQWRYRHLLAQLQEVPEPVERVQPKTPDSEGGDPSAADDSRASKPPLGGDAKAAAKDPVAGALADSSTPEESDDLRLIRGIGAALEVRLNQQGVYRFSQIANWDPAEIAKMSEKLHLGQQIERFSWVEQAKSLQNSD